MSTSINFPDSPNVNDTYEFGSVTYIWDGTRWYVAGSSFSSDDIDTLAELNAIVSDATLDDSSATRTPTDGSVTRTKLATALKGYTNLGNVSGTVNIDCSLGVHYKLNMTGDITSLTFSNYSTEQFKTITLEITGNYTITQPTSVKGDWSAFDGSLTNQIQIYLFDVTTSIFSSALINW